MSEKIPKVENGGGNLLGLRNTFVLASLSTLFAIIPAGASQAREGYQSTCRNNQNPEEQTISKEEIISIGPDRHEIPKAPPLPKDTRQEKLRRKIKNNDDCVKKCKKENTTESGDIDKICRKTCHKTNPIFDIKLPDL